MVATKTQPAVQQQLPSIEAWRQFFAHKLGIKIVVVEPDSDDHELLLEMNIIRDTQKGILHDRNKAVVVKYDHLQALKTLIHESMHVLYYKGYLKRAVKGYKPSKRWLMKYSRDARKEEATVESVALWATDLEPDGSMNCKFKEWLAEVIF